MAMICSLVCSSNRLMFLEDIALVKSQTRSIQKWAFSNRILSLQSVANIILLG